MKSGDRRAAIVQAAARLFAEKGFRGTTTRELARAVGVTEPVLYQHFGNKRELYHAILESQTAAFSEREGQLRQLAKGSDDGAFFRGAGHLIAARYRDDPDMARLLLFSSLERQELSELFFERISAGLHRLVTRYIRRRAREGAFRAIDPAVAARGFIGMVSYHGFSALLLPGHFGGFNDGVVDELTVLFLEGITR
jgi:AcrR family transcriptional regulator